VPTQTSFAATISRLPECHQSARVLGLDEGLDDQEEGRIEIWHDERQANFSGLAEPYQVTRVQKLAGTDQRDD
jgi:hypothetical protein